MADPDYTEIEIGDTVVKMVKGEKQVVVNTWRISRLAFKNRFPRAKWAAFQMAAKGENVALFDIADSIALASFIDLQSEETVQAVHRLSMNDVPDGFRLTDAEVDAVLQVPASLDELP